MNDLAVFIGLLVGAGLAGLLVIMLGLFPDTTPKPAKAPKAPSALGLSETLLTRSNLILMGIGLAVGVVLWLISGWFIALVAAPALALIIPMLLGAGKESEEIEKLQALEIYTRSLSGMLVTGAGLEETIQASVRSAPPEIKTEIDRAAARLTSRWTIEDTLRALADDLADPTGDFVVMQLRLAARERGPGLARALQDLADDVFDEVKVRRQIAADRAKPRRTIRLITLITIGLLALLPLAGTNQFFALYATPFGQILLAGWLTIYVVVLFFLKQYIRPRPMPRALGPITRRG